MEITGQGEELAAKLINTEGDVFMAKVGTTLRNGFTIDEITQTYLSAVKDNAKDVLYFSPAAFWTGSRFRPTLPLNSLMIRTTRTPAAITAAIRPADARSTLRREFRA